MEVLYDDEKVSNMEMLQPNDLRIPNDALEKCPAAACSLLAAAVETYAIALGRKMIFHARRPDVEANYSLDRFFRSLHVENDADGLRHQGNEERYAVIASKAAFVEMVQITRCTVRAAQRLDMAQVGVDIFMLVLGEACNAYAFSEYLRNKTGIKRGDMDCDLEEERRYLAKTLEAIMEKGGIDFRMLKRFADSHVFQNVLHVDSRACRPESRHRREIVCCFTSFQAMHRALTPQVQLGRKAYLC